MIRPLLRETATSQVPMRRRLRGFVALPLLGGVVPILVVPAVTSALGVRGWAALATGQAIGTVGAAVILWGWSIGGPSELARSDIRDRGSIYAASVISRCIVAAVIVPLSGVVALWVARDYEVSAAVTAIGTSLWGLSTGWYFVGIGSPGRIAMADALPRNLAFLAGAGGLQVVSSGMAFAVPFLGVSALSLLATNWAVSGRWSRDALRDALTHLRDNVPITGYGVAAIGYMTLAIPLSSVAGPAVTAAFAAGDRIRGAATVGVSSICSAFQGWIFERGTQHVAARQRVAFLVTTGAGVAAGTAITVALPLADSFLLSGTAEIALSASIAFGLTVALMAANYSLVSHFVVPSGSRRPVVEAAVIASILAVTAVPPMARAFGASGVAWVIVGSHLLVTARLLIACRGLRHASHTLAGR
jgi:hypothetical protein